MVELWIPDSARERFWNCNLCGTRFPQTQKSQWDRHVRSCAKRHRDEIEEQVHERSENPILSPLDKERHFYLRRNPRNRGRKARHLKGVVG